MMKVCTSNGNVIPSAPRYGTHIIPIVQGMPDIHTYPLVSPSVDSAHLSSGQKTWLTLEWSCYRFALEVCNQTEGLSHLVHRPPLYIGVRLYSLAHLSRPVVLGVLRNLVAGGDFVILCHILDLAMQWISSTVLGSAEC